jgi:hypothetical protein
VPAARRFLRDRVTRLRSRISRIDAVKPREPVLPKVVKASRKRIPPEIGKDHVRALLGEQDPEKIGRAQILLRNGEDPDTLPHMGRFSRAHREPEGYYAALAGQPS